jgi:hypothetical protein
MSAYTYPDITPLSEAIEGLGKAAAGLQIVASQLQSLSALAQLQAAFLACTNAERAAFFAWLGEQAETKE